VTDPRVLFGEPTEGIQPSIIKDIARILNELRRIRDITIIVSSRSELCLAIADRVIVLEGGQIVSMRCGECQ